MCASLSLAWVGYIGAASARAAGDMSVLVGLAVQVSGRPVVRECVWTTVAHGGMRLMGLEEGGHRKTVHDRAWLSLLVGWGQSQKQHWDPHHACLQVIYLCDAASKALAEARAQGLVGDGGHLGGALAGGEIPLVQVGLHVAAWKTTWDGRGSPGLRMAWVQLLKFWLRSGCTRLGQSLAAWGAPVWREV